MESKKTYNIFRIIMLVLITAFVTFIITAISVYNYANKGGIEKYVANAKNEDTSLAATLSNFKSVLEQKYVGEINENDLTEGAIKGYVAGLGDPYTEYLTKDEMTSLSEETQGEYMGVGIYIANNTITNEIVVLRTIGNSPAYRAGLLTGDIIKTVDNVEYTGEQLNEASNAMKGESGTTVKIKIIRNGEEKEFEIKREVIKLICVTSKKLENEVGYVKISSFDGGCAEEFKNNYEELKKQGINSLVIDLRYNGGGLVDEALNIAELMVDKDKTMLITKSKNAEEVITKSKSNKIIDMPIVVLVNEYSASASEILTGILKESVGATVVGKTTYGKGVIQTVYQLSDGSGLKITTDEYYTPNHNVINKVGIKPDEEIELPKEWQNISEVPEENDTQLKKAIELIK